MVNRLSILTERRLNSKNKQKIAFIVGPTGVGKTEIAIKLSARVKGEIISCDSMQIYKKMNIITQKPSRFLQNKVKHHLFGAVDPRQDYNAADYQSQALLKINEVLKRGKIPIFVGGTGFYMSVLLDGLFNEGEKNKKVRDGLTRLSKRYGSKWLHGRLKKVDSRAASRIHPNDLRRIIRALEVYRVTGIPISTLQRQRKGILDNYNIKIFCLNRNRQELYERINRRVDEMFKKGLTKEVKALISSKLSKTASQAIGIKEIEGYLKRKYDLEEAKRLVKRNSRHYAKRQLSWFRRDRRINWIFINSKESTKDTVERIWKKLCW